MTARCDPGQICDAAIEDSGGPRCCQRRHGHYPATRHKSVLRGGSDVLTWLDEAARATPATDTARP